MNMKDIAKAAGVSKSCVSLALKGDTRIALATRQKVQRVAEEMGYRKNPVIASLMAQMRVYHTPKFQANIALVNCTPNKSLFALPVWNQYRVGIREHAEREGYQLEEFWGADPAIKPLRLAQILTARNIRGVVLAVTGDGKLFVGSAGFFEAFCFCAIGTDTTLPLLHRVEGDRQYAKEVGMEAAEIVIRQLVENRVGLPLLPKKVIVGHGLEQNHSQPTDRQTHGTRRITT